MTTVLGLDLSLSSTGLAIVRDGELYSCTAIPTSKDMPWVDRIKAVLREIDKHLNNYQVDTAYIENYSFDAKFGREVLGELHGVVMYYLTQREIPFHKVSPTQVKLFATGQGRAPSPPEGVAKSTWPKKWVVEAVNKRYNEDFRLSENDKVDAFLVALLGYYVELSRTNNLPVNLLDYQQKVVNAILNPSEKSKGGNKNGKRNNSIKTRGKKQPV